MRSPRPVAHLRPRRAVLYLRQSTYREESISLELQEAAGREYARKMGYEVVAVESDPGISGRTWKRPAVQRVMRMLEDGEADTIVLWRWSRLSRSRRDWAVAADRADLAGATIESATEPNDATAAGRFARGVMTELAAFESERIGEQWKETHGRRRSMGLPSDGGPRYGYDKLPDGGYTLNNTEAPILAEMYRRYLSGDGFTRITYWANNSGHLTKRGGKWSRITMTMLLDSGWGAGMIVHRPMQGEKRDRTLANSTFYPGAHPAVITEAEWDAYLARRGDRPAAPAVIEPKYMLAGLIVCGECGSAMHGAQRSASEYRCSRATQVGDTRRMSIRRALVEQFVRDWVDEIAADLEGKTERIVKAQQRRVIQLDNVATLDKRIDELKTRMGRITVRWSSGAMPDSAYDAAVTQLDTDLALLVERRRRAAPRDSVEIDPQTIAAALASDWEKLTVVERRRLLGKLIEHVRIMRAPRPGTGVWRERILIEPTWEPDSV